MGAEIAAEGGAGSPERGAIDSRDAGPGELFFGLRGESVDGGEFAAGAIAAGAWGVVVEPRHAAGLEGAWVFAAADPLAALQALARAWRRALGARVVGVTGSVGKTSVKDIARALLPGRGARQPREPQHRDRAAADRARGARRRRAAGPGDGDARTRPDRRAGGDRRARRRGDHQRRPGPRRAAGLGRGDRRGQGRGPRRAAGAGGRGRPGRRRRARAAPGSRAPRCFASAPAGTSRPSSGGSPRASPRR